MGTRVKTFDNTGIATAGRIYAGDLNLIQDQYADLTNFSQTVSLGTLKIGETGLQLVKYGTGEARITGLLRTDGIIRGLGGLYTGAFTTTQRDAIASGFRPFGLVILNTTTNRLEWNAGTDGSPSWVALTSVPDTAIANHIASATAHIAANISYAGGPTLGAANVEAALDELSTEKYDTPGAWSIFTPTLLGAGGNPNLGTTGTAHGLYAKIGRIVHFKVIFAWAGTTVSAGSGVWTISGLPVNMVASPSAASYPVGAGMIHFTTGKSYHLHLKAKDQDEIFMSYRDSASGVDNNLGAGSTDVSIAAGATAEFWGTYESVS